LELKYCFFRMLNVIMTCFNQTILELKFSTKLKAGRWLRGFNQTILELKLSYEVLLQYIHLRFNQTILELK